MSKKEKIQECIEEIYNQYKDDEYMQQKLENYICNQLPTIMEHMKQTQIQRQTRYEELSHEQDLFIQSFLNDNQYFYIPATNNFFIYNGMHYKIYSEDEILYCVLSSISKVRQLISWKHKTKINIMKRIKDNNLLLSIPETETIQGVKEILSNIFSSNEETKYFLCVLGDNLLKKHTNLIHFISPNAKNFIKYLNNMSSMILGLQINHTIKYKYHDHEYKHCRIININHTIKHDNTWNNLINNYALDIFCVACYYSNKYNNSDEYILNNCNNENIVNTVTYIKNNTPETLVNQYLLEYIDESTNDTYTSQIGPSLCQLRSPQISWKNMQYLWKLFLDHNNIPSVLFINQLKHILISKLNKYYNAEQDMFVGICSKYLPSIQLFIQFWNENIIYDDNESEFEIEELMNVFKQWIHNKNDILQLNDKQILDLIHYYYPTIEIEKDKMISGIRCKMWDKQLDIQVALDNLKEHIKNTRINETQDNSITLYQNISIYNAYLYYCKFIKKKSNNELTNTICKQIVSKSYFEKYIFDNYEEYIIDNKFLTPEWYTN